MERVAPFMRLSLLGIIRQSITDKLVFTGGKNLIPLFTASQPERFVHEIYQILISFPNFSFDGHPTFLDVRKISRTYRDKNKSK